MTKKERVEKICPVCKRRFMQSKKQQMYCATGCAETATKIKRLRRWTVNYCDEILEVKHEP